MKFVGNEKMKKVFVIISGLMCLMLVMTSGFACETEDDPSVCATEDFNEQPTAENFESLENPTVDQFDKLPSEDKVEYLTPENIQEHPEFAKEYLDTVDSFSNEDNAGIAKEYFAQDVSNINTNPEIFSSYVNDGLGVELVGFTGALKSFDDTQISSLDSSILLEDFKEGGKFKDKFAISIVDGKLVLVDKTESLDVEFTGDVTADKDGNIDLTVGSIKDYTVLGGKGITVTNDNILAGEITVFDGIVFEGPAVFVYNEETNTLEIKEGTILSVPEDIDIFLSGNVDIVDYSKIKGDLNVKIGDTVIINGIKVDNSGGDLAKTPVTLPFGSGRKSFKYSSGGDDYSTEDIESIKLLQEFLVTEGYLDSSSVQSSSTEYDEATSSAVKKFQDDVFEESGTCLGSGNSKACSPDGIVGRGTQLFIESNYMKEYSDLDDAVTKDVKLVFDRDIENLGYNDVSNDNVVLFADDGIFTGGDNFQVSFSPVSISGSRDKFTGGVSEDFLTLHNRGYFKSGDNPKKGSEEYEAIVKIQNLVGATPDGNYGPATKAKVEEWQKENDLVVDGVFGEDSLKKVLNSETEYNGIEKNDKVIVITPDNGFSYLELGEDGLVGSIEGEMDIVVGNKEYKFHDEKIIEGTSFSNPKLDVSIPSTFLFKKSDGTVITEAVKTVGAETRVGEMSAIELARDFDGAGGNSKLALCGRFVKHYFNDLVDETVNTMQGNYVGAIDQGVTGDAWEMKANMLAKGGISVYDVEKQLTPEEQEKLDSLVAKVEFEYNKINSDSSLTSSEKKARKKALSKSINAELTSIIAQGPESQVELQSGDVLAIQNRGTSYSAEAIVDGSGNKNSHVAIVKGSKIEFIDVSGKSDLVLALQKEMGIASTSSLNVNKYYDSNGGSLIIEDGVFVDSLGNPVENIDEIKVERFQATHLYAGVKVEFVDSLIDKQSLSLYGVTRASSQVGAQIASSEPNIPNFRMNLAEPTICTDCGSNVEIAKASAYDVDIVPDSSSNSIRANLIDNAISAAVETDSGGNIHYDNVVESAISYIVGDSGSKKTYTNVKPVVLVEAGEILGEDVSNVDVSSDDSSDVVMRAIFKEYIPTDKTELSEQDLMVIGSALDNGIKSDVTKAIASGDEDALAEIKEDDSFSISTIWRKVTGSDDSTGYAKKYSESYNKLTRS